MYIWSGWDWWVWLHLMWWSCKKTQKQPACKKNFHHLMSSGKEDNWLPWNVHQCCRHQAGYNVSQRAERFVLNLEILFWCCREYNYHVYISIVMRSADRQVPALHHKKIVNQCKIPHWSHLSTAVPITRKIELHIVILELNSHNFTRE